MFFIKHPERTTSLEELQLTRNLYHEKIGMIMGRPLIQRTPYENKKSVDLFINKIQKIQFSTHLPDTTCFIFHNTSTTRKVLKRVYELLLENKLQRDQNVIQYALYLESFESKLGYFHL